MAASEFIKVTKSGQERTMTRKQWDILGTDKYGWEIVPIVPKEVARMAVKSDEPTEPEKKTRTRKPHKNG